ncbi:MAG: MFS transporter [Chloroflexi bacterium]|nr:MFS transporter [Chloroflexota bacterium]
MSKVEDGPAGVQSVLRNRPFLRLWLAQALSQTAQNSIFYALMVFIEKETGSSFHMSLLILTAILPSVTFGMAAGVFVDRWSKRTVLVTTNILRGVAVLAFLLFEQTLGLIYLVNLIFSVIGQFFAPAELSAIPCIVPRRQLITANGLFNLTFTGSQLAGFVIVAPLLIKWLGPDTPFLVIAFVFGLAAILVSFLPSMDPPKRNGLANATRTIFSGTLSEFHDGWRLLRGDPKISLSMVHLTLTGTLVFLMGMLAPGFSMRIMGVGAEDAVYIFAPAGIGVVIGIIVLPRLATRWPKDRLVTIGLLVTAVTLFSLGAGGRIKEYLILHAGSEAAGLAEAITVVMAVAFVLGLGYALVNIPAQTIVQEKVPEDMRGRIFATQLVFGSVASILPLVFLGGLADRIGVGLVILILGGVVLGVGVFSIQQARKVARRAVEEEAVR